MFWICFETCCEVRFSLPMEATTVVSALLPVPVPVVGIRYVTIERATMPRRTLKVMRTALSRLRNKSNIARDSADDIENPIVARVSGVLGGKPPERAAADAIGRPALAISFVAESLNR